jgi:hypothetical protein
MISAVLFLLSIAALFWLTVITLAVIGIRLYGAHLAKLSDQRAKDGVNWSMTA